MDVLLNWSSIMIDCVSSSLSDDRPLIVQFAAHDAQTLADAACVVAPFSDGVDLNCGCPQRCNY